MTETINLEKVYMELLSLRQDIQSIKKCITEIEFNMSCEEEEDLVEAINAHNSGKTKKYEDLREELMD